MAGMPQVLVERAAALLGTLESKQHAHAVVQDIGNEELPAMQLSIFDAHTEVFSEIRKMLAPINVDKLTPVEALVILSEIKKRIK
jgi:DNA mismatch repair protein MutS